MVVEEEDLVVEEVSVVLGEEDLVEEDQVAVGSIINIWIPLEVIRESVNGIYYI